MMMIDRTCISWMASARCSCITMPVSVNVANYIFGQNYRRESSINELLFPSASFDRWWWRWRQLLNGFHFDCSRWLDQLRCFDKWEVVFERVPEHKLDTHCWCSKRALNFLKPSRKRRNNCDKSNTKSWTPVSLVRQKTDVTEFGEIEYMPAFFVSSFFVPRPQRRN